MKDLLLRYVPGIRTIPLRQGISFKPTGKALPTVKVTQSVLLYRCKMAYREVRKVRSCFPAFPFELASWQWLMQYVHSQGMHYSQGCLWAERIRYPFDRNNRIFAPTGLDWFEQRIGPLLPSPDQLGVPVVTGRLGCSIEGIRNW